MPSSRPISSKAVLSIPCAGAGERPLRLPVLHAGDGLIALSKPPGLVFEAHPVESCGETLLQALVRAVAEGSRGCASLGIETPYAVYHLDAEASGLVLIATNRDVAARWREHLGACKMLFTFAFLARGEGTVDEAFRCDLPVAQHLHEPRMLVSHRTGKQAETVFRCTERFGEWALWEAETRFPRLHQIRLHAAECALDMAGEQHYTQTPLLYLSQFKRRYRGRAVEKPLYDALALHLGGVRIEPHAALAEAMSITCPLPDKFSVMLRKLREYTRG